MDYRKSRLHFDRPVDEYSYRLNAIPVGNGAVGCMYTGGPSRDVFLLNHERLRPLRIHAHGGSAAEHLPSLRDLAAQGQWTEAGELYEYMKRSAGCVRTLDAYHPVGELTLEQDLPAPARAYRGELDLAGARGMVQFESGRTSYRRIVFAPVSTESIVIRILSDGPDRIVTRFGLGRRPVDGCTVAAAVRDGTAILSAEYEDGTELHVHLSVTGADGTGENVEGSAEYRHAEYSGPGLEKEGVALPLAVIEARSAREITAVLTIAVVDAGPEGDRAVHSLQSTRPVDESAHTREAETLFHRCRLSLDSPGEPDRPVSEFLGEAFQGEPSPKLFESLFDFGRYLLLSSSRPGTLPAHLQGIWSESYLPPWQARYQLDINLQANYWAACPTGLSECELPLFDLAESLLPEARLLARDMYGCRGIVFPVGTDGRTVRYAPNLETQCVAGWIGDHFYRYWEYTQDEEFLEKRALPFLTEVALFFEDLLVHEANGLLTLVPSASPENTPANRQTRVSRNATIDIEVCRSTMRHLIEASRVLIREERPAWRSILARLPDTPISPLTGICEWADESALENDRHRHLSHLYPVFPGDSFDVESRPELVDAAVRALERRMTASADDACSFTYLSAAFVYARAGSGEDAYRMLVDFARGFLMPNLLTSMGDRFQLGLGRRRRPGRASHIFQIESGLAIPALISEMLLQSHSGVLRLLPALPDAWYSGRIDGLRARGGVVVDCCWRDGALEHLAVHATQATIVTVVLCRPACGGALYRATKGSQSTEFLKIGERRSIRLEPGVTEFSPLESGI